LFQELNLPHDVNYPSKIPIELIYGVLSLEVHNLAGNTVYVASTMKPELKKFYAAVATIEGGQMREYCEEEAVVGKQHINR